MSASGCPSYQFWMEQAQRWQAAVDYGSPMSAWTDRMHKFYREANGDTMAARKLLLADNRNRRNNA